MTTKSIIQAADVQVPYSSSVGYNVHCHCFVLIESLAGVDDLLLFSANLVDSQIIPDWDDKDYDCTYDGS